MLISFLIPSRGRFDSLLRAIKSIGDCSYYRKPYDGVKHCDFDVHVKFDDDDLESIRRIPELAQFGNVTPYVFPRLNGYAAVDHFCSIMAGETQAQWICIFNDDAMIEWNKDYEAWDAQLSHVPTTGFIVQPETHQLNLSRYDSHDGGPFPIVPNGFWNKFSQTIPHPSDSHFETMRKQLGWKTHFLKGVTFFHDRNGTVPQ